MKIATSSNCNDYPGIGLVLFAISVLSVVTSFNPGWHMWGLDYVQVFPIWIRIILLACMLIILLPRGNSIINLVINKFIKSLTNVKAIIIYSVVTCLFVILFLVFTSHNHFLGDGYTIIANLKASNYFAPTEPLDYLIHYASFKIIGATDNAVYWSYLFWSYICGIIFLWGLYILINNKIHLLLALTVAACFTVMQFFFGYVESYTFRFILMFFYCLSAINDYKNERLSLRTIILLCIAIAFHLSSGVLILSPIYLFIRKYPARRQYLILAVSCTLGISIGVVYLYLFSRIHLEQIMVPFGASSSNPYALFSIRHLKDLGNIVLLNYPFLLVAVFIGGLRRKITSPFYLLMICPALLFNFIIDPKIGAFRDWDLMSIAAAPILAFLLDALLLEKKVEKGRNYSIFAIIAIFGLLHTGSWIYLNSNRDESYARVKEAIGQDIHYSRNYYQGHMNKSWTILVGRYHDDAQEVVRAGFERYYGDPGDTVNTCQLAGALLAINDTAKAAQMALENSARFPGSVLATSLLSVVAARAGHFSDAENICHRFLSNYGDNSGVYYSLGNIKKLEGQIDSLCYYHDKAYILYPETPIESQYNLYLDCFERGFYKIAQSGLMRIYSQLNGSSRGYANEILGVLKAGNPTDINSLRTFLIQSRIVSASP